jgi:hypothetical protein
MIRRYAFPSVGSSSATSRCPPPLMTVDTTAPMHCRIIRCWRPRGQNLSGSFHVTVGWTAVHPSVHPVLKASSWRISILFKLDHWTDRRFPPMDHWFIRRCYPRSFSSPTHPTQLGKRPSVHPTISSWFQPLRSVPSAPTLAPMVP